MHACTTVHLLHERAQYVHSGVHSFKACMHANKRQTHPDNEGVGGCLDTFCWRSEVLDGEESKGRVSLRQGPRRACGTKVGDGSKSSVVPCPGVDVVGDEVVRLGGRRLNLVEAEGKLVLRVVDSLNDADQGGDDVARDAHVGLERVDVGLQRRGDAGVAGGDVVAAPQRPALISQVLRY
jgi:hypothetical protein